MPDFGRFIFLVPDVSPGLFLFMLNGLFDNTAFQALERGLDACSLRAQLIANNIANADTPNFKAQRLRFEELLAQQLGVDRPHGHLPLIQTDPRHLPGGDIVDLNGIRTPEGVIYTDNSYTQRLDGNSVDADHEMAEQAKNAIQYTTLTELASRRLALLRTVISEGRR